MNGGLRAACKGRPDFRVARAARAPDPLKHTCLAACDR
jgi:hypothetical protein